LDKNNRIAAVILASGISKRMGTTKQLLPFHGVPLLEYLIQKLIPFPFYKIYAIIGHNAQEIMGTIEIVEPRFDWVLNNQYQEGKSAALKKAVKSLDKADGMMVFLADQPLILAATIGDIWNVVEMRLMEQESKFVVQPSFSGKMGHPVFFAKELFPFFDRLQGDEGGKRIIKNANKHYIIPVEDAEILFDVDTPADYQLLLRKRITDY
jgi:molybdenum cofactor cytidylyltransferase